MLVAGAIWWRGGRSKLSDQTMHFSALFPLPARDTAMSPNGHTIAVVAYWESARRNVIWIYELGSNTARSLSDTVGANYPFWSADGQLSFLLMEN
jgi:Tol biopolymer transport system component